MLTREETIKIFENCRCGAGDCNDCPMECDGNGFDELSSAVLHYLKEPKENEPALSANSTSSEVVSKDTNSTHLDDSTKDQICQEAEKAYKACELILEIYERMDDSEQKAFDLGQSYRAMVEVKKELERIGRGGVPNA
mgnify:CR=1 FL=1|jgi:hypothetical protein